MSDVRAVKEAVPEGTPVLVGSGVTEENIGAYMEWADGVIVGTSVKVGGVVSNPVDRGEGGEAGVGGEGVGSLARRPSLGFFSVWVWGWIL